MLYALKDGPTNERASFQLILVWLTTAAALWVAGGLSESEAHWGFWIAAILVDLGGRCFAFRVTGKGASSTADWSVDPEHMAPRCGLFVIIALGKSIIVTGATCAELPWIPEVCIAFVSAFVATVAMWWAYFVLSAEAATEAFAHHKDPGAVARAAYTFRHPPIVAGIIVTAVSEKIILAHPTGHITDVALVVTLTGRALFLFGAGLFCWSVFSEPSVSPAVGRALLAGLWLLAPYVQPIWLSLGSTAVIVFVAAWQSLAQRRELAVALGMRDTAYAADGLLTWVGMDYFCLETTGNHLARPTTGRKHDDLSSPALFAFPSLCFRPRGRCGDLPVRMREHVEQQPEGRA